MMVRAARLSYNCHFEDLSAAQVDRLFELIVDIQSENDEIREMAKRDRFDEE